MTKLFLLFASLSGATAVMLGAFGAHALKPQLSAASLDVYQTAVFYQFVHTVTILIIALWLRSHSGSVLLNWSASLHITGIVLFCGSLYLLALGGPRWLGPITPLGGLSFIAGWILMALAAWRS